MCSYWLSFRYRHNGMHRHCLLFMARLLLEAARALQLGRDDADSSHCTPQQSVPHHPETLWAFLPPGSCQADGIELGELYPDSQAQGLQELEMIHLLSLGLSRQQEEKGRRASKQQSRPGTGVPVLQPHILRTLLAWSLASWLCDLGQVISSLRACFHTCQIKKLKVPTWKKSTNL